MEILIETLTAVLLFAGLGFRLSHGDRPAPHSSGTRSPVLGMNGMVATSQPLASAAALRVLQDGGNAVDAAITAAAVLNVVEPPMTGIGGDMFALLYMQDDGKLTALNGSGWAGSKATIDHFKSRDMNVIPGGIASVSVPGAVAGWFKLHSRYGRLPMSRLLGPAIGYAENGFPVSEIIAGQWQATEEKLRGNDAAARTYLIEGRAPRHGELFRSPDIAATFHLLADEGRNGFYKGEIAQKIVATSDELGGFLTLADFAEFDAQWVEPISTNYRGYDVYELPPNTQGIIALEMLNILENFDLKALGHNSVDYLHTMVETKKLAFADRDFFIADPDHVDLPTERLISKEYGRERRKLIDPDRAQPEVGPGLPEAGDTVYLTVVDRDRNAVSFINSLFFSFGSGVAVDGTGIMLHNRGGSYSLDPTHSNSLAPRKRPFHTLVPAMILKDGRPFFSFGVMGGDMQPQGHIQVIANIVDFGMDVQHAGEAPRFRHSSEGLALESAFDGDLRFGLARKGHRIIDQYDGAFGGYQGILIDPETGVLMGGSDPRKDGMAMGW